MSATREHTATTNWWVSWRELYDQYEEKLDASVQRFIRGDVFAASMAGMGERHAQTLKMAKDLMEAYWERLRLATKTDHAALAGQIVALEEKIDRLADTQDALVAELKATRGQLAEALAALGARPAADAPEGHKRKK